MRTSEPNYYRWTQWIFLKLFDSYYDIEADKAVPVSELILGFEKEGNINLKAHCDKDTPVFDAQEWNAFDQEKQQKVLLFYRLTYLSVTRVNWCPALGTVLANDEIVNGVSEREDMLLLKRRCVSGACVLEPMLIDFYWVWMNWIGLIPLKKCKGTGLGNLQGPARYFEVENHPEKLEIFTTRPDTIFGVTYITLAQSTSWSQRSPVLSSKKQYLTISH